MCIRDRNQEIVLDLLDNDHQCQNEQGILPWVQTEIIGGLEERDKNGDAGADYRPYSCLLYTSDAADERSSVDLGGRRIIKKKKKTEVGVCRGQY